MDSGVAQEYDVFTSTAEQLIGRPDLGRRLARRCGHQRRLADLGRADRDRRPGPRPEGGTPLTGYTQTLPALTRSPPPTFTIFSTATTATPPGRLRPRHRAGHAGRQPTRSRLGRLRDSPARWRSRPSPPRTSRPAVPSASPSRSRTAWVMLRAGAPSRSHWIRTHLVQPWAAPLTATVTNGLATFNEPDPERARHRFYPESLRQQLRRLTDNKRHHRHAGRQ